MLGIRTSEPIKCFNSWSRNLNVWKAAIFNCSFSSCDLDRIVFDLLTKLRFENQKAAIFNWKTFDIQNSIFKSGLTALILWIPFWKRKPHIMLAHDLCFLFVDHFWNRITFVDPLNSIMKIESPQLSLWFFVFIQEIKAKAFILFIKQKNPSLRWWTFCFKWPRQDSNL